MCVNGVLREDHTVRVSKNDENQGQIISFPEGCNMECLLPSLFWLTTLGLQLFPWVVPKSIRVLEQPNPGPGKPKYIPFNDELMDTAEQMWKKTSYALGTT
nr:hypothetical protein Iba_chr07fCG4300 [Ipomoea batatas]